MRCVTWALEVGPERHHLVYVDVIPPPEGLASNGSPELARVKELPATAALVLPEPPIPYLPELTDVHEARDLAQRLPQNRAPAPAMPADVQDGYSLGHLVVLHSWDIPLNP